MRRYLGATLPCFTLQKALTTLLRGHELELAVSIAAVLGDSDESIMGLKHIALQLLSRRCEHLGKWSVNVSLGDIMLSLRF